VPIIPPSRSPKTHIFFHLFQLIYTPPYLSASTLPRTVAALCIL
jgi:hypothetical protein